MLFAKLQPLRKQIVNKHHVFMRDVICKHHPLFVNSRAIKRIAVNHPLLFNIERLVEESMAAVGGYNFVDEEGRDFDDLSNSDCKTTTVINDGRSRTAIISSVENKIGSLRVVIYNPFKDRVDYMYIPKKDVTLLSEQNYGKQSHKMKIRCRWNEWNDHYNKLERFRVESFATLATIMK